MYYCKEKNNFFQGLHPLTLTIYYLTMLIGALVFQHPFQLLILLGVIAINFYNIKSTKIWLSSAKFIFIMFFITTVVNVVFNDLGGTRLYISPSIPVLGIVIVSLENIIFSLIVGLRLLIIYGLFMLYNITVNPDKALSLWARVMPNSSLLISLTTKTLPSLKARLQRIKEIQQVRGVDYNEGSLLKKIVQRIALIKILLYSALEDSFNIGQSIQGRAYGIGKRSCYHNMKLYSKDWIILSTTFATVLFMLYLVVTQTLSFQIYPRTTVLINSPSEIKILFGLVLLLLFPQLLGWRCSKSEDSQ
ncbi:energy-coupling factor transporter transmembrane component T [Serpentinicella sp. ANB-PHB4]|uniref:energy-coupling factor transporter transmembrane component T n=1 Tax=Serpentinicella sp. ANB-PHB4 TaxID=3074076 RepID=UPI0028653AEB|nr:energy-coupling factor transporter transmembrane component T [Serpentinicella sp. ANB-PHB4]MDR5659302.1 energy-coupling factor transporter transmembrane component T [Serpentinicella sp. ANB-PHB4]